MIIKICGITNPSDAITATAAGADMLGFNFYAGSPRCVTPEHCREIIRALPNPKPVCVGVFVNADVREIEQIVATCGLDLVQLSGDEEPQILTALKGRAFKALRPASFQVLQADLQRYPAHAGRPAWLIDACQPGFFGGTGQATDWSLAASLAKQAPILLAGGLTPQNVAEAITRVRPWGVDVASGIESSPGMKDPVKLENFIKNARTANQTRHLDGK